MLRNEAQTRKAICDRLLAADRLAVDRKDAIVGAIDKTPDRLEINSGRLGLRFRDLLMMRKAQAPSAANTALRRAVDARYF